MTTYYVPVERKSLPASDPMRWVIIVAECITPVEAMAQARDAIREMRLGRWVLWAAVRDIPSFQHMQRLRECMDACKYANSRRGNAIPGYV